MKSVSGIEFAKILERHGWRLLRISGSHHIYIKKGSKAHISLPIHGNKPMDIGLLRFFMKAANLSEDDI